MDSDKRKATITVVAIGLIIFLAILYFLWGAFLNRGTLIISGITAPFEVEIFGIEGKKINCETSPCKVHQRIGEKTLIISKEGFQTLVTAAQFKLWRNIDFPVELQANPKILGVAGLPETRNEKKYDLIFDEPKQMYKLINVADSRKRALIYFTQNMEKAQIIGTGEYLLILDTARSKAYKIDLKLKTKKGIPNVDFGKIDKGKWSDDGSYLAFIRKNSPNLEFFNSKNYTLKNLDLVAGLDQVDWTIQGLAFATLGASQTDVRSGQYQNYIRLLPEQSFSEGITFGFYHPEEDSYSKIGTFSELVGKLLPEKIIATSNGQSIYFQIEEEYFMVK